MADKNPPLHEVLTSKNEKVFQPPGPGGTINITGADRLGLMDRLDSMFKARLPEAAAHEVAERHKALLPSIKLFFGPNAAAEAENMIQDLAERQDSPKKDDTPAITAPIDDEDLRRVMLEPNF